MEASSVKRSSNSPPNKCVEHNIGVDGVSERHSGIDHRTKSEKTNGRCDRFQNRELPLPTQMHRMASNQGASTLPNQEKINHNGLWLFGLSQSDSQTLHTH